MALNQGKSHKFGVGVAENAASALFLCPKKPKMPVYFCSLYVVAKTEQKVRTEEFERLGLFFHKTTRKTSKTIDNL